MCWKCDHPDSTMQEWLEAIYASVQRNGWVVQFVTDRTPFAYTIGLHPRGLPELLVTGMPPQRATQVLNSVAQYLVGGGKPVPGERILIGGELLLDVVQVQHPDAHLKFAVAFYGADLRALQLVWPDDARAPAVVQRIQQWRGATAGVRHVGRATRKPRSTLARRHAEAASASVDLDGRAQRIVALSSGAGETDGVRRSPVPTMTR